MDVQQLMEKGSSFQSNIDGNNSVQLTPEDLQILAREMGWKAQRKAEAAAAATAETPVDSNGDASSSSSSGSGRSNV